MTNLLISIEAFLASLGGVKGGRRLGRGSWREIGREDPGEEPLGRELQCLFPSAATGVGFELGCGAVISEMAQGPLAQ